ncbi:hypothetical protein J7M23_04985 [Candidatus Sumerlaeota bacterium]|nr:hypothetical protein [Candidatus Sumerlaeota bacterium]
MKRYSTIFLLIFLLFVMLVWFSAGGGADKKISHLHPTRDNGRWFFLKPADLIAGSHHTHHTKIFGKYITGYNYYVLKGIDTVQAHSLGGGGYFTGIKAVPPESPVGYRLKLFSRPLLEPPRPTSYCTGATYAALIEALNLIFPDGASRLSPARFDAMRMQEPDGSRRKDGVKFWGHWNDNGFGCHYALVQYSGMGTEIKPRHARPGDFMNISWRNGRGHSAIFLGWTKNKKNKMGILYWSSQKGTNGYGDVHLTSLSAIKEVKFCRLTRPENLFRFDINKPVKRKIKGDKIRR